VVFGGAVVLAEIPLCPLMSLLKAVSFILAVVSFFPLVCLLKAASSTSLGACCAILLLGIDARKQQQNVPAQL
jgi:hypothetical protein